MVTICDGPRAQSIIERDQNSALVHQIGWPCSAYMLQDIADTRSQLTCSNKRKTSASSRCCSVTRSWRPPRQTASRPDAASHGAGIGERLTGAAVQIQARAFSEAALRTRSHKERDCGFVPFVSAGRPLTIWLRWKARPARKDRLCDLYGLLAGVMLWTRLKHTSISS